MKFSLRGSYLLCGLCLIGGVALGLGEWGRPFTAHYTTPGVLVIAGTAEPSSLHPVFGISRMATVEILGALFEPLTLYDDQQRLIPCLATEIPNLHNGGLRLLGDDEARARGGRMESVWHLRPVAFWSDGVPVTADDFVFTWQLIRDPAVPAVSRELEDRIAGMESRDGGRTLVVLWHKPYAFAHEGHRHLVIPRHVEEPVFRQLTDKKDYEQTPFNRRPVGNGPYQLVDWAFGRHLVLAQQPYWHGPAPAIDRLVYRFLPEGDTVLANLDAGRVGAVSPTALDSDLVQEFENRARTRRYTDYVVHSRPGLLWMHLDFNTENPLTADRRVRQALAFGLNRRGLCESLFPGQDCATDTWLPPTHPACFPSPGRVQPDLSRYPYDPARAAQLLESAGWRPDAGGVRTRNGVRLELTLKYPAGEPITDRVAQLVKEDWRRLGVALSLRPEDTKKFSETSAENLAYQGLSLYTWIMDPSADGITFWTAENIPTEDRPANQNTPRWRNPRSDALLYRATETLDVDERRRLLWEQQRLWAEDLPAIPLFFQQEVSIRHHRLQGWRPTGTDTPITWNCPAWRWEPDG